MSGTRVRTGTFLVGPFVNSKDMHSMVNSFPWKARVWTNLGVLVALTGIIANLYDDQEYHSSTESMTLSLSSESADL